MEDRLATYILFIPVSIIILLLITIVLLNLGDEKPSNPVGRIPKVIFDHVDGEVVVTVVSVGDQRYDSIHLNYTVDSGTYNLSTTDRYSLDVNISASSFVLNVTVVSEDDHYMFNCTINVKTGTSGSVLLEIREEDASRANEHHTPYTVLAEWREIG